MTPEETERAAPRSRLKRLGWFLALWLAGTGTVAALAYAIRAVIL